MKPREVSPDQLALLVLPAEVQELHQKRTDAAVWAGICDTAIERAAASGRHFTAYDLAESYGVPDPPHPNHWGIRFQYAHRAGVIRRVGYQPSRRASVAHSAVAVWVGAHATTGHARQGASGHVRTESRAA
jgi:hypothetical protein